MTQTDQVLGNLLRDDLDGIESSPKFRRLREEVDAGVEEAVGGKRIVWRLNCLLSS